MFHPTKSTHIMANLPNLRRLFVEARSIEEESKYSRNAVCLVHLLICWTNLISVVL